MDAVHQQEEVEQPAAYPMQHLEWDEPNTCTEERDAAQCHHSHHHEDSETGDRREDVGPDAVAEVVIEGGVEPEAAQVREEVDSGPEQQTYHHHQVEQHRPLEWKYLQWDMDKNKSDICGSHR